MPSHSGKAYNRQLEGSGKKPTWHFYESLICSSNDTELVQVIKEIVIANEFMS
jgi:hypothetical protein